MMRMKTERVPKMMKSMKKMVLTGAAVMVMMSFAAPAMADEVQGHHDDPPVKDLGGIRLCDITPTDCQNTDDDSANHDPSSSPVEEEEKQQEDRLKDPGIRLCDITPTECQDTAEEDSAHKTPPGSVGEYSEYCKLPSFMYDPACDKKNNEHSQDSNDSQDEQGPNSGARPDAKDPNPGEKEEPTEESKEKEESSAPGAVKAGEVPGGIATAAQENDASAPKEVVSAPDEAGQLANSPTTTGCPFDYEYDEEVDRCLPGPTDYGFGGILLGALPWPDSAGGYVALPGNAVADALLSLGVSAQVVIGYGIGDTLVDFGEGGGPIGWGIQGLGYTIGFGADAVGVIVQTVGEAVGAVSDTVGEVIDGIGDAAEDAWDEVSSWF